MGPRDRLSTFFTLAMLAYLGFYVFGLVLGVYAPGDVAYFTIPAVAFTVIIVVQVVRSRRGASGNAMTAEARHLRETRGF